MDKESIEKRVFHLREVEKLTFRQIAGILGIGRERISRILRKSENLCTPIRQPGLLDPYHQLIAEWYKQYPKLRATQICDRIKSYGYQGSYPSVVLHTKAFRRKKRKAYHTLNFLPGEEAQVDFHEGWVTDNGIDRKLQFFVMRLCFSKAPFVYPYEKANLESFLDGHVRA